MALLSYADPIVEKFQRHLEDYGVKSTMPGKKYDFEGDYLGSYLLGTNDGIGSAGSLKIENSPIDFMQILKKQEYAKCDFTVGGHVGMGIHRHTWWMLRFFLVFPDPIKIGPLDIGTLTTIKKKLFHSEVESYIWNGYKKLTTLPPGLVYDNVAESLDEDQRLKQIMTKCLLKERTITISRYSPCLGKGEKSDSKIIIKSKWKLQKDIFIDPDTIDMYQTIAQTVKQTVNNLKYHLT